MTVDDIAREAGIAKGTLYAYFKSKEEVALATIDGLIDNLVEELQEIARATESPANRLQQMLVFRILYLFDRAQERSHTLDDMYMALRPQYKAHRDRYMNAEAAVFAEVIVQGQEVGDFDPGSPSETAEAFILATSSLTPFSLSIRELGARDEIERKIRVIAKLLIHGIICSGTNSSA